MWAALHMLLALGAPPKLGDSHRKLAITSLASSSERSADSNSVDSYTTVECPAKDVVLQRFLNVREAGLLWELEEKGTGTIESLLPPNLDLSKVGAPVVMLANTTTRKKLVLVAGETRYKSGVKATEESPVIVKSVVKMVVATIFLSKHRDLLDTEVLQTCGVDCGLPAEFIAAFLTGKGVTYRDIIYHTSGVPIYEDNTVDNTVIEFVTAPGTTTPIPLPPWYAELARRTFAYLGSLQTNTPFTMEGAAPPARTLETRRHSA